MYDDPRDVNFDGAARPGETGNAPGGEQPLVGIIRNPRSHRNLARKLYYPSRPHIMVEAPRDRTELRKVLAEFAAQGIRYLAISGGDGTVRDVLTCGYEAFGDNWPEIIVLPRGKTNALGVDLRLKSSWSLADAMAALDGGRRIERRPLLIRSLDQPGVNILGFVLGAGAFAKGTELGQATHSHGAFQSFAVGLTIVWSVLQIVFGGAANPWRQPVAMRLYDGRHGPELPHSRQGKPEDRFLLLLSTLRRFPLGIRPFGRAKGTLRLAIMDTPSRRGLLLLPLLLTGFHARWVSRLGFTRHSYDSVRLDTDAPFIVDGELFAAGHFLIEQGPRLSFVVA